MKAVSRVGSIPTKRVRVEEIAPTDTDEAVLDCAMEYARETRSSLFGWSVDRNVEEGWASVSLYTD